MRWLIEASRGGATRARILLLIREEPLNVNQLARKLGLNYRSVLHHINVLLRNGLIVRVGEGYGSPFILSREAEEHWDIVYESICRILGGEEC
ncbi:MAG: winged helix-turn-helix domain-containing protein [Desulfurococcales archaeon]|nr:winged helix-turn-helix domain-containing protein [Desulfurococcales archaeon]